MPRRSRRTGASCAEAFERHGGREVDTQGDSFLIAFERAAAALAAAGDAQAELEAAGWPGRVRIGVHTGEPEVGVEGYVGIDVHRAARICAAAHGGQVVLSASTRDLVPGLRVRDLGDHRLKDLEQPEHLYQLDDVEFPPLRSLGVSNIPVPANALVGRTRELDEAHRLLARTDVRLVTLTGPGGTGKSRLALELAAAVAPERRDGAQLVPLAPVADPELVPAAIAAVFGLRGTSLDDVIAYLREHELLLFLDNFEHLAPAAPMVARLLAQAPTVTMLVTSRTSLHVLGEHVLPVPPLRENDAIQLFHDRVAAAGERLEPGSDDVVREICRRLDGLPLAIELAAARIALLPPEALLERLGLAVLGDGPTDLPERQRTLRATIDWSYGLLTPGQRELHEALSVFAGGCTFAGAEAVAPDPTALLAELGALVDGCLLRRHGDRLTMLETVREYARERLGTGSRADEVRSRHARHYATLAAEAETALEGEDQPRWLVTLDREVDDLRAAIEHSLDAGDSETALQITTGLGRFWRAHGHVEDARRWLEAGLAAETDAPEPLRARALWLAGWLAMAQSDHEAAAPYLEEAHVLFTRCGYAREAVFALSELANVAQRRGDSDRAVALATEAVEAAQAVGDARTISGAANSLASILSHRGDFARARPLLEESLSLRRTLGNPMLIANSAYNLGVAALHESDLERAAEALEETLALARDSGDSFYAAYSLCMLGEIALLAAEPERAEPLLRESLDLLERIGDARSRAECLHALAAVVAAEGNAREADLLSSEAAALRGDAPLLPWEAAIDAQLASFVRPL